METNVVSNVTGQFSLNSRVGVVGPNGAGKSTMIKLLTGEMEPCEGVVWKHPNLRVAYVAQHAFHHIEQVCAQCPVMSSKLDHVHAELYMDSTPGCEGFGLWQHHTMVSTVVLRSVHVCAL